jgi:hypothetical protein
VYSKFQINKSTTNQINNKENSEGTITFEQVGHDATLSSTTFFFNDKQKHQYMSTDANTTMKKAAIFRITGFVLAAFFLYWLKSHEAELPKAGFMGRDFCHLMSLIGIVSFAYGSYLRYKVIRGREG